MSLIDLAIRSVVSEQLVSQVLVGGGTDEISGIWGLTGVPNVDYGAQGEFDRQDALDVLDSVRLSDTDGGLPVMVASKGLWQLMQKTPRGTDGTSSAGYTEINRFVLDDMMYRDEGAMGMVEGTECHYFSDLKPASVMDPGLVFKASRCVVWLFGNSLALIEVPSEARKTTYKLTAGGQFCHRPASEERSPGQTNVTLRRIDGFGRGHRRADPCIASRPGPSVTGVAGLKSHPKAAARSARASALLPRVYCTHAVVGLTSGSADAIPAAPVSLHRGGWFLSGTLDDLLTMDLARLPR